MTRRAYVALGTVMGALIVALVILGVLLYVRQNAQQREFKRANIAALHSQVSGECYRVDYLRWQDDKYRYAGWLRDRAAAHFLSQIRPPIEILGAVFINAANQDNFLPLTDCTQALAHPDTYRPPPGEPFVHLSPAYLARVLNHPPQPPK